MGAMVGFIDFLAHRGTVGMLMSCTLFFLVVINLVPLPVTAAGIRKRTGGVGILDTHLFYTPDQAYEILQRLGPAGRAAYLRFLLSFDLLFPSLYSLALSVLLTWMNRPILAGAHLPAASFAPFLTGLFDYLENAAIIAMLLAYPRRLARTGRAAGYFTLAKWLAAVMTFFLVLTALARMEGGGLP